MAIGMTLNQLYAPPPSSSSAGSAPASSSSSVSAPLTPPQGRSPKDDVKSGLQLPPQPQPQMDRVYQMPPYSQQPFNPAGYPSTSVSSSSATQYQPLAKPGPSTSEDYAADPIPFEYSRKYTRDDASSGLQRAATIVTSSSYADSYGSHPVYAQSQQQQRLSPYAQQQQPPAPQYPEPRSYHHDPMQPQFPTRPATSQIYAPMPGSMLPLPNHPFPPLLDVTKKEVDAYPQTQYADVRAPMSSPSGTAQEAMIKVKTPLKLKYWRNGRRNLQCFPSCKVFGDYSAIKIEDLKQHDFMWGKCRGSLVTEVTLNSNVTFDDLVLLGRVHSLENIPVAFEEAVIRECMLGRTVETDEMDAMKDQWITGERLPDFVQQDGNVACFEFKPKVWKYTEDMAQGKCKRRNVKYYVQFEAFVQMAAGDRRYYACIGSGMSTSFEVGSSRVLARQKRKAATSAADAAKKNPQGDMVALQPQQLMAHNGNALLHSVMATHPMSNPMYVQPPASYSQHHDGQTRGLPPTFPHPQVMMNQMPPQQQMPPEMHYPMPQQQQQQLQPPPMQQQQQTQAQSSVGEKRKMNSERPAFPTDRASKMLKPMSGVPQSVPI